MWAYAKSLLYLKVANSTNSTLMAWICHSRLNVGEIKWFFYWVVAELVLAMLCNLDFGHKIRVHFLLAGVWSLRMHVHLCVFEFAFYPADTLDNPEQCFSNSHF